MPILKFNDGALGSSLIAYYNPTDDAPDVDGDNYITTMRDGYGVGPDLVQRDATDKAKYIAGTKLGAMEAITFDEGGLIGLSGTLANEHIFATGTTIVTVFLSTSGNAWGWHHTNDEGGDRIAIRRNWSSDPGAYHSVISTGTVSLGKPRFDYDTPMIHALRIKSGNIEEGDTSEGEREYTLITEDATFGRQVGSNDGAEYPKAIRKLNLGCSLNYTGGLSGLIGLHVIYDAWLTDPLMEDVIELCRSWLNTGGPPTDITYPKAATFGPVRPNDPLATLDWEVNRIGYDWVPYDTAPSGGGLSDASTTNTGGHEGDTLQIKSALLDDACAVRCVARTSYNTSGIITAEGAALNVVEGSS